MTTPNFAPGPWAVDWNDYLVRARSPIDGRMIPVARPYGVGDDGSDVPANARLIAAAPDMYEALKHETEWHEAQARTHKMLAQRNPGMVYDGLSESWHRGRAAALRAVLSKAEGKS